MLMLTTGLVVAGMSVICLAVQADAADTSGGLLLVTANTARASALGGAGGTLTGDPGIIFYNPAGLQSVQRVSGLFTHQTGIAEDYSEILNFAMPFSHLGVLGVTFVYHGMPSLNDAGTSQSSVEVRDILGIISLGRPVSKFLDGFSCGLNLKFLNSTLGEYSANTLAADIGVLWEAAPEALVGLAVKNLGLPLKFIDEADPLPLRIVLSAKYDLLSGLLEKFFVALDIEQTLESETSLHMGGEFFYAGVFAARLGYALAPDGTEGMTFGVGVRTAIGVCTFRLDYAYRVTTWSSDSFGGTQFFTVGLVY